MSSRIFGSGIRRREDPRLITGAATYTDDLTMPDMLHAVMLRSPHAHAKITRIDISRAQKAPGVISVYTGADVNLNAMPCAWLPPNSSLKIAKYPTVAVDTVRYVGDVVAFVVAETPAGGHSLIPLMKLRLASPSTVIDIGRIPELRGVTLSGGTLTIGALTTHAELAASATVHDAAQALAEAAGDVGDPAVRNRGTIGGNVAHADPASDLPAVLTALGATFTITGPGGRRTVAASDFFKGMMDTAVGEHDILTTIDVPAKVAGQGSAYAKFEHPASRYAVVGVAACVVVSGGTCSAASIVLCGLTPSPVRAKSVEQALVGQALTPDTIAAAAAKVGADLGSDVLGDIFASAEYRAAVAPVYVRRAVEAAASRAR